MNKMTTHVHTEEDQPSGILQQLDELVEALEEDNLDRARLLYSQLQAEEIDLLDRPTYHRYNDIMDIALARLEPLMP